MCEKCFVENNNLSINEANGLLNCKECLEQFERKEFYKEFLKEDVYKKHFGANNE